MAMHHCLKEWINGYELSVSIDDNLCGKFRAEVILFKRESNNIDGILEDVVKRWESRSATHMAKIILDAKSYAERLPEGDFAIFITRVVE